MLLVLVVIGLIIGGILIYRNNQKKADAIIDKVEETGKEIKDAVKKV